MSCLFCLWLLSVVRIIDALHGRKKFCGMTGDGVIDSPSLKKADVGISVGIPRPLLCLWYHDMGILAWEVIDMRRSLFAMKPDSDTPYTQVFKDVWGNKFLFWFIIGGFCSCFPVVYIPVTNDKVFLNGPIGKEWGISIAASVMFWSSCEV